MDKTGKEGMDKEKILNYLRNNEENLVELLIDMAKQGEYTRYNSTRIEDWLLSIRMINEGMSDYFLKDDEKGYLHVDDDYTQDKTIAFGVKEAKLHRSRGVTMSMFLGLTKYYRLAYINIILRARELNDAEKDYAIVIINLYYDKFEIGFCSEWVELSEGERLRELQENNRLLTNEKNKMHTVFHGMSEPVIVVDPDMKIREINKAAEKAFDIDYRDAINKHCWEVLACNCEQPECPLHKAMREAGRYENVEIGMYTKKGLRWFLVSGSFLNDISGKFAGGVELFFDVTETRENEQNLRRAMEMAKAASEAKSNFLANMSHEIRTPMNGILGYAEILMNSELNDEQRESVRAISQCGEQLLDLINDILDLSKIESGKIVLDETDFSIQGVIDEAITSVRQHARDKGLEIRVDFQRDVPVMALGDPTRIRQVVSNLLSNAVKFTSSGYVKIAVSRAPGECPSDDIFPLRLAVEDTGIGIPLEKRELVFEAFIQADGSTTRKFGGTGLGLAICKSLVDRMNGEISLKSEVGFGSAFTVSIPVKKSLIELPQNTEFDRYPSGEGANILIVEDDWVARQVMELQLKKAGYNVISTSNGGDTMTLAVKYKPRVIILDLLLPDLSGWQVLQKLKNTEETAEIPVIICSILFEKEKAISLGAVDYLEKPVREQILLRKVHKYVSQSVPKDAHVLIVDDEMPVLDYLEAALGKVKCTVHKFQDSRDALIYLFSGGNASAIILDLMMPGMDGFEFLNRLRANEQTTNIPVIIYTAKNLTSEDFVKLNNKYQSLLEKSSVTPGILMEQITQLINEVLDATREAAPAYEEGIKCSYNVLLAEDNEMNKRIIETFLKSEGHHVYTARDGLEALLMLDKNNIDVVLMDMQMPVMDGYEATGRIRTNEKHNNIPIIALTAYAMKGDAEKCLEAGCDDYLSKPVKKDNLISVIEKHLCMKGKKSSKGLDDPGDIDHLIPFFKASVSREVESLRQALEAGDYNTLCYIGHGLKGSCGAYGFHKLSEIGGKIERSAERADRAALDELLALIETELKDF